MRLLCVMCRTLNNLNWHYIQLWWRTHNLVAFYHPYSTCINDCGIDYALKWQAIVILETDFEYDRIVVSTKTSHAKEWLAKWSQWRALNQWWHAYGILILLPLSVAICLLEPCRLIVDIYVIIILNSLICAVWLLSSGCHHPFPLTPISTLAQNWCIHWKLLNKFQNQQSSS